MSLFGFWKAEIGTVANRIDWTAGLTIRYRHKCDMRIANCYLLQRMVSPCRWRDAVFIWYARFMNEWRILGDS